MVATQESRNRTANNSVSSVSIMTSDNCCEKLRRHKSKTYGVTPLHYTRGILKLIPGTHTESPPAIKVDPSRIFPSFNKVLIEQVIHIQ